MDGYGAEKRFLRDFPYREPVDPPATDLIDVHSIAFTRSYPRILRHPKVGSKLRQMPLLYQKVSISSSEEVKSGKNFIVPSIIHRANMMANDSWNRRNNIRLIKSRPDACDALSENPPDHE